MPATAGAVVRTQGATYLPAHSELWLEEALRMAIWRPFAGSNPEGGSMDYAISHVLGAQRNGLNHVSMNLGDFNRVSGPVRDTDYPTYSDALLDWYQSKNVKSVRLMFTWEAVQAALGGPVPPAGQGYTDYWTDLTGLVMRLLARDIYVILAPWQYNTASGDTDIVYDDAAFTAAQFADFWGKFAADINATTGDDQRVAFDLINEPHTHAEAGNRQGDIGISVADWFSCAQAAIDAIRDAGASNTIFVPGMAYTAASSFTTNGSAEAWLALTDPQNNIALTVHCYSGLGSASPMALSASCSALVTWARANGIKVHIGEIAIDAGANGNAPHCSTFATAQAQWTDWHEFCVANNDVLVGWNWWANSASGWWNAGDSCNPNGFHWGLTLDDGATQTIYMDLIEATLQAQLFHGRNHVAGENGQAPAPHTGEVQAIPGVSSMKAKANKAIVHRFFEEVWNKGNLDVIGEIFALDHYEADPMIGPTRVSGMPQALDFEVRIYRAFFPDLHFAVEETVAEGDTVIARWVARGTHTGTRHLGLGVSDGEDIQPTGKQMTARGFSISRIADGKIRKHEQYWSNLSLLEALALVSGKVSPATLMEHLGYLPKEAVPPEEIQPIS